VTQKLMSQYKAVLVVAIDFFIALLASNLAQAQNVQPPRQFFKCSEGSGVSFTVEADVGKLSVKIIRKGETLEYVNGKTTKGGLGALGGSGSIITSTDHVYLIPPVLWWRINSRNGEMIINGGEAGSINLTTGRFQTLWRGDMREISAYCKPSSSAAGTLEERGAADSRGGAAEQANQVGGYVVRILSQRHEVDAWAVFRTLQGKFPSLLGSRALLIKRVDTPDKGVFYRGMIGPFASIDEASRFCDNLKAAGGTCEAQRN
jgi:sporulation related protein